MCEDAAAVQHPASAGELVVHLLRLVISLLPLLAAANALVQCLHARVHVAVKYAVQVNLITTLTDDFIAQLQHTRLFNEQMRAARYTGEVLVKHACK